MAIELFDVSKQFGDKRVLDGFSFRLPDEGVVALLGPSGCGKTTLLRLLAGLEKPDAGRVELDEGCKLSMVFQEDRLLPALSALDNVRAPLGPEGGEIARACLSGCGLDEISEEYPDELSGGMRRRVAIARALAFRGDLLLLDEAFKGLDPQTKTEVMRFVFEGPFRPRRCVMVTHEPDEALDRADRILVTQGIPLRVAGEIAGKNRPERARNKAEILSLLGAGTGS